MATESQKELRKKWVEALRSGQYKQTVGVLYDGTGYCCLGVACKVMGVEPETRNNNFYFDDQNSVLSINAADKLGLKDCNGEFGTDDTILTGSLTTMNDDGMTFEQIADMIEYEPEGLFND